MSPMKNYFAYGSNMNWERLTKRVGSFQPPTSAFLKGYRLSFNKIANGKPGVGYANIVPSVDSCVEGVLYRLSPEQLVKLAKYEGVSGGHYKEVTIKVWVGVCFTDAITFIACEDKLDEGLLPEREYLNHLLAGKAYLSREYFAQLEQQLVI